MIKVNDELKNDFLVYAKEVNENRAFPDAIDGLKPVQRAALWEMFIKGYSSNKPHVKSAKVTGGTIATWHPHGDASVYDAIVRMSQDWINNIPEIDWHGANGSLQGGPQAASSRYTECRLPKVIEEGYFGNIKKNTIDMILNFSEDEQWPKVFPALFPRLFVNGSQGIGYTISQEWEPGNLKEFTEKVKEYIKSGKVNCDDIYPDYPTGGIIINKDEIKSIYETGSGSITLRGKTEIDGNIIKITELPYQVYAEPLIQNIKDLVNSGEITGIDDIYNKSDDSGLLIEVICEENPENILTNLFKLTSLQTQFNANQVALVDGTPVKLTLKDYIKVYVDNNIKFLKREYEYELKKAEERSIIVTGLIKALDNIDKVIEIVKQSENSDQAALNLVSKLKFKLVQAKAIVDMKLGKLTHLETDTLKKELESLTNTIEECNLLLRSKDNQNKEFIKRLSDFTKKYGWDRKTEVTNVCFKREKAKAKANKPEADFIIAITKGNTIKRIKTKDYKEQGKVKNDADKVIGTIRCKKNTKFSLISETGKVYKLKPRNVSLCNNINVTGDDLGELVKDKIIAIYSDVAEKPYVVFFTEAGKIKKMEAEKLFKIRGSGTVVIKLENDKVIFTDFVSDIDILNVTVNGKSKPVQISDYKAKGKSAGGVRAIKIKDHKIENVSLF